MQSRDRAKARKRWKRARERERGGEGGGEGKREINGMLPPLGTKNDSEVNKNDE